MQMLNAIAEPSNAMTVSKDGTRIARRTMMASVKARMTMRMISLVYPEDLLGLPELERGACAWILKISSKIVWMGRVLSGYCQCISILVMEHETLT